MYSATLESAALVQIHPTVAHLCRARSRRNRQSRRVLPPVVSRSTNPLVTLVRLLAPSNVVLNRHTAVSCAAPQPLLPLRRRAPNGARMLAIARAREADHPSERNWLAQFHARHPAPRRTAVTCRAVSCWPCRAEPEPEPNPSRATPAPSRRGAPLSSHLMSCQLSSSATRLTTGTSSPGASE